MMTEEAAKKLALIFCMQTGERYLECLDFVVSTRKAFLPSNFVAEIEREYATYSRLMSEAGYLFKDLKKEWSQDV